MPCKVTLCEISVPVPNSALKCYSCQWMRNGNGDEKYMCILFGEIISSRLSRCRAMAFKEENFSETI